MKELTENTITKITLSSDNESLTFHVTDGETSGSFTYDAEGDCCSHSWFNDILGVDALIGGTVVSVEALPMEDTPGCTRADVLARALMPKNPEGWSDVIRYYGYKITTDKGYAKVAFRNSSNGYYGGYLSSVKVDEPEPNDAIEITDDWSYGL